MKTAEDFRQEMESSNIFKSKELTFKEYSEEFMKFQNLICKMIAGDSYYDGMRFGEAQILMEKVSRKKGLRGNSAVHNAIQNIKELDKQMAITMSGIKGEKVVSKTLEYLDRPNTKIFRNVYITDGVKETELDDVVLTDSGIIILEVKKVTSNLTLTEEGRLVFDGNECHDDVPLAVKMALKRRLLKKVLEDEITNRGLNIPVYVDSFIVFCAPKGQYININDRYHKEKHCFRTGVNKKIEDYFGCAYYKENQLEQLGDIFSKLQSNEKRFECTNFGYEEVCENIAQAMEILQDTPEETFETFQNVSNNQEVNTKCVKIPRKKDFIWKYAIASILPLLAVSGGIILKNKLK